MSPSESELARETESPAIPPDLRQRIAKTVGELREQHEELPFDASAEPAAPPKRRRLWIAALLTVMIAELALIAMAERMDGRIAAEVRPKTPCEMSLGRVEAALESFRTEEGRLPGTLEQLVPKHIEAIPRVSGRAVEYDGQGTGYVLHCRDS